VIPRVKRILIIGSAGQDGRILAAQLVVAGKSVVGVERRKITQHGTTPLDVPSSVDVRDFGQVQRLIDAVQPDEAYYLAAHHHSAEDIDENNPVLFERSQEVHVGGLVNLLETLRLSKHHCRVFYAASSHVFGFPKISVQNESTALEPRCVYGITKTAAVHACRFYRERHGLHVSIGILFNHESPFRGPRFVSQRIVRGALDALTASKERRTKKLTLGNLASTIDWGYAPDYVDAMTRIVAHEEPDDFVVATGVPHTVRDFVSIAFAHLGLDWSPYVEENPTLVRKPERTLVGDASKLRSATGWKPSVDFQGMVKLLLDGARSRPT
jgi:GDPmannose 4,6-dehydratase